MSAPIASFAQMIAPLSSEEFFATYWEKRPLFLKRGDPHFYDGLVTGADIQNAVSSGGLRYPATQLSKAGGFLPPEAYCNDIRSGDVVFTGVPDLARIQAEYESGATLSLPGFHRASKTLTDLACAVEAFLDHGVHTNVYVTPGAVFGFGPHHDVHDVFIFQISGVKHWQIRAPIVELPHTSQPFRPQMYSPCPPLLELDIEPGDLLYLPRGFIHSTTTSKTASIHVTLGVTVYTFVEMLAIWLQSSKNDASLRRALPPGFARRPEAQRQLKDDFVRLVDAFREKLDAETLVEIFLQRVREGYPGQRAAGDAFDANVVVVGPQSLLATPPRERYRLIEDGGNIILEFDGGSLTLAKQARPALDAICKASVFRPAELRTGLSDEIALALVRRLHKEGFLIARE